MVRQSLNATFISTSWVQFSPLLLLKTSRLLGSSRDFGSSESRSPSWKLPSSLTSPSRSYDRPWAESTLSGRSKSVLDVCAVIHFFLINKRWNATMTAAFIFPRLIPRARWGCARSCRTLLMMVILKGPKCPTATEDSTQEHPAL